MNYDYLSSLYSQLSMVFRSGIPAASGFLLLAEQEKDPEYLSLLNTLYEYVDQGMPIHKAMRETGVFSDYMLNMTELGEYTGKLDDVFSSLSEYCWRQSRTAKAISEAFAYPLLLLVTMLAIFVVMIVKVLPIFSSVLAQFGVTLTPLAATLLGFGEFIVSNWVFFFAAALVIGALVVLIALIPSWRKKFNGFTGQLFLRTDAGQKILSARFSAAMSMIMSAGLGPEASVDMLEKFFCGNAGAKQIEVFRDLVLNGASLAEGAAKAQLLKGMDSKMLSVAIKSGKADSAMSQIADRCHEDMRLAIDKLTGRVEPVVIILMSAMVGLLMLSVLLPLLDILSALG